MKAWQFLILFLVPVAAFHISDSFQRYRSRKWGSVSPVDSPNASNTDKKKPHPFSTVGQRLQSPSLDESTLLDISKDFWLSDDPQLPPHFSQQVHVDKRTRWACQWLECAALCKVNVWQNTRIIQCLCEDAVDSSLLSTALQPLYRICIYHSPPDDMLESVRLLCQQSLLGCINLPLMQVCQVRWAARGLAKLLQLELDTSQVDSLVQDLPFDIVPQAIDWTAWYQEHIQKTVDSPESIVEEIVSLIPFQHDTITTRTGEEIEERRGTAWLTRDSSIGALAYSGKLMPPQKLHAALHPILDQAQASLPYTTDVDHFFDCLLCNHYPNGDAACRFHADPEHGSHWHCTTAVISAGTDRKFAFRRIDGDQVAWTHLFSGDMVVMRDKCNDEYYHAVRAGDDDKSRVSLVLKRALDLGGGRKGHGLARQGRRRNKTGKSDSCK